MWELMASEISTLLMGFRYFRILKVNFIQSTKELEVAGNFRVRRGNVVRPTLSIFSLIRIIVVLVSLSLVVFVLFTEMAS